ncbi:MAG: LysM peptidoglycan-binding domain-containing protein [Caldilineae bacterium]|nr:LysM peptidoglycan-binding domain-containing protein [Chloroflexota bacterium]MCB9176953.1 LysM peptidoglycan-binding domain-containing protein [Caldilineae bacterium]
MKSRVLFLALAVFFAGALFAALPAKPASANYGNVHCVQYGETLYGIGRAYGVSPWAIAQYNGLYNPNYVRAGTCLSIPAGGGHHGGPMPGHGAPWPGHGAPMPGHGAPMPGHGHQTGWHIVKYGETLYSIGRWYGVSPWAIAKANGLYNVNYIRAGQSLYIPGY